jgi:hypothetical protein
MPIAYDQIQLLIRNAGSGGVLAPPSPCSIVSEIFGVSDRRIFRVMLSDGLSSDVRYLKQERETLFCFLP